jgi:hypothetical protein
MNPRQVGRSQEEVIKFAVEDGNVGSGEDVSYRRVFVRAAMDEL